MGARCPRPLPRVGGPVLLQAVGRRAAIVGRPHAGRGGLEPVAGPARGDRATANTAPVVLVEFDSLDAAIACHDTPGYTEALRLLGKGNVERDMRVVEGTN